ncbi:hypothetical protein CY34DRAFT_371217 [Suillus luteus UH-Slu-Lm8-n1]|uniref:Uncharacterized protein n=1 Tax=Suillus luteus UH-Slu-Lm8-n1 TaxID=930992 RepID=A0A0D0AKY8_9AGAM|nr:hypothetical protein CY34DRAFT_371217 [Suillus luteus UH-Slu-Lm8-n1]
MPGVQQDGSTTPMRSITRGHWAFLCHPRRSTSRRTKLSLLLAIRLTVEALTQWMTRYLQFARESHKHILALDVCNDFTTGRASLGPNLRPILEGNPTAQ